MSVRPLAARDAAAAADLLAQVLSHMVELPKAARSAWIAQWTPEAMLNHTARPGAQVLRAGDDDNTEGLLIASAPEAGVVTVIWVLVANHVRSQGVGEALMTEAIRRARGCGAHKLRLTVPGLRAKRFYERCGMREEGFFERHWFGADFWQMAMWLGPQASPAAESGGRKSGRTGEER